MQLANRLAKYVFTKQAKIGKSATLDFVNSDESLHTLVDKGTVRLPVSTKLFRSMAAPQTATDTATLTTAQLLGGVLVATPTAAAAYTVPTGTELLAALPATIQPDDSFDLTIINVGATTNFDITMTAATDITFVGQVVLRPGVDTATEHAGQGTWRFRYVSGVTFVAYRVG